MARADEHLCPRWDFELIKSGSAEMETCTCAPLPPDTLALEEALAADVPTSTDAPDKVMTPRLVRDWVLANLPKGDTPPIYPTSYDPLTCCTAGELRAAGAALDSSIPDVAWVPRVAIKFDIEGVELNMPEVGRATIRLGTRFAVPFRWVEVEVAPAEGSLPEMVMTDAERESLKVPSRWVEIDSSPAGDKPPPDKP